MTIIRKARKLYHCCMCSALIKPGDYYGQNGSDRECAYCVGIDRKTGKDK